GIAPKSGGTSSISAAPDARPPSSATPRSTPRRSNCPDILPPAGWKIDGERNVIAALVLAAGLSRRMGHAKLVPSIQARPVIRIAVETVLAASPTPVVVVTGAQHRELERALAGLSVTLVNNPSPEAGQASSMRIGINALPVDAEAVVIALGDQPFVPPIVID